MRTTSLTRCKKVTVIVRLIRSDLMQKYREADRTPTYSGGIGQLFKTFLVCIVDGVLFLMYRRVLLVNFAAAASKIRSRTSDIAQYEQTLKWNSHCQLVYTHVRALNI